MWDDDDVGEGAEQAGAAQMLEQREQALKHKQALTERPEYSDFTWRPSSLKRVLRIVGAVRNATRDMPERCISMMSVRRGPWHVFTLKGEWHEGARLPSQN